MLTYSVVPDDDYWLRHVGRAMGSDVQITLGDADPAVLDWARRELERLEQCWSRFRPSSELNAACAQPGTWIDVSTPLLDAFHHAQTLFDATGGLFDPTIADALHTLGYDRTFTEISGGDDPVASLHPAPGFTAVELDTAASRVRVPEGVHLDLGGIGKGLAADRVAEGAVARGARTALVALGGDVRAHGAAPDGGWNIPVEHPTDSTRIAFTHPLPYGAIVTSTTRIRRWQRAGIEYHHLIDPRTGDAARSGVHAVVGAASSAWWAEGIAKAALIGGVDSAAELSAATHVHLWCWLSDGSIAEFPAPQ